MHDATKKASVSFTYPTKLLNEPFLLYQPFLDNTNLLVSSLSMLIGILFL